MFSRKKQVKEFQDGKTNLTDWESSYEEEMNSSDLTAGTPTAASAPVSNRVEQIQVCS